MRTTTTCSFAVSISECQPLYKPGGESGLWTRKKIKIVAEGHWEKVLSCHDFLLWSTEKEIWLCYVAVCRWFICYYVLLIFGESYLVCISPCPPLPLCLRSGENGKWYFWAYKYTGGHGDMPEDSKSYWFCGLYWLSCLNICHH